MNQILTKKWLVLSILLALFFNSCASFQGKDFAESGDGTIVSNPEWQDGSLGGETSLLSSRFSKAISLYVPQNLKETSDKNVPANQKILVSTIWIPWDQIEGSLIDRCVIETLKSKPNTQLNSLYEVVNYEKMEKLIHKVSLRDENISLSQYLSGMLGANFYIELLADEDVLGHENQIKWKAQAVDTFSGLVLAVAEKTSEFPKGTSVGPQEIKREFTDFYQEIIEKSVQSYDELRHQGEYFQIIVKNLSFGEASEILEDIESLFQVVTRKKIEKNELAIGGYGQRDTEVIENRVFSVIPKVVGKNKHLRLENQEAYSYIYLMEKLGFYE